TYWPPAFVIAASIIAVIALALAIVLIRWLSSWGIALHLVLFENQPAGKAFGSSAKRLSGHKARLVTSLVVWVVARGILGLVVAAMAGALFNIVPGLFGTDLRSIATATIVLLLLWAFANATVAALSNGALADLLYRLYLHVSPDASRATAIERAEKNKRSDQASWGEQEIGNFLIGYRALATGRDSKRQDEAGERSDDSQHKQSNQQVCDQKWPPKLPSGTKAR
ncbi:unnamed protein product, partial [marine sediment metagenome]